MDSLGDMQSSQDLDLISESNGMMMFSEEGKKLCIYFEQIAMQAF